jgi:hypothetical protein
MSVGSGSGDAASAARTTESSYCGFPDDRTVVAEMTSPVADNTIRA